MPPILADPGVLPAVAAPPWRALSHLPHCGHPPLWVDLALLRDTLGFARGVQARAGPVSRARLIGRPQALLMSADAIEAVLGDTRAPVSAAGGWAPVFGGLFPGGLVLRDGEEHREHRRRLMPALRRDALGAHVERMAPRIDARVADWHRAGRLDLHDAARRLALDLAGDVFLGIDDPAEAAAAHHDFEQIAGAVAAVVRWAVPATRYGRGMAARRRLAGRLLALIPVRRDRPGPDLFSQLCAMTGDGGRPFTDQEIVDHMIFLWMAAHDTTRSAITTLVRALALQTSWQDRLRDELRTAPPATPPPSLAWALHESLRLFPPIPTLARQLLAPMQVEGFPLPAGTLVTLFLLAVQRDPRWWPDPDRFDPLRFDPARSQPPRHRHAWVPFGGGLHRCLGLHFAQVQVAAVLRALLLRCRWRLADGSSASRMAFAPVAHPRDGLRVDLTSA